MSGWSSIFLLGFLALILLGVALLERRRWSARQTAIVSMLAALGAASRIPFAILAGFQPATFFVILAGYKLGPLAGMAVGFGVPLLSNFVLGQGPWTLWQMAAWGLCGVSAGWLGQTQILAGRIVWMGLAVFGVVWAYLFGAILTLWGWLAFVEVHTWSTWWTAMLLSLWADTLHAVSNALFLLLAGPPFSRTLERFTRSKM